MVLLITTNILVMEGHYENIHYGKKLLHETARSDTSNPDLHI
jgi:hypothetical protein